MLKVWWKSFFWIVGVNLCIVALAWSQGGRPGLAWGFLLALSINYYLWLYSPLKKLCPRGARKIEGRDSWGLFQSVEEYSKRLKVTPPQIYVWESPQIQCFIWSKWPGKSSFGISETALKNLNEEEVEVLVAWSLIALKSGRVINWTYLGLFLHLILIVLSFVDRILSLMVTKRINRPHGVTLWITAPLIYLMQRLFCSGAEFLAIDQELNRLGISANFSSSVIKKIHFQNHARPLVGHLAFAHLYFSSQLSRGGMMPLLRVQPSYKKRILRLRGSYPV